MTWYGSDTTRAAVTHNRPTHSHGAHAGCSHILLVCISILREASRPVPCRHSGASRHMQEFPCREMSDEEDKFHWALITALSPHILVVSSRWKICRILHVLATV